MSDSVARGHDAAPSSRAVHYHEKLVPSPGVWVMVLLFGLACYAVGAPISIPVAILIAVVMAAGLGVLLWATSPVLEVTEDSLQVGRAHIEREFVGEVEVFRGESARMATGPGADGRAFMNFRPWVSPIARIQITDPADPTPYWLTNSRRPEELARVLGSAPHPDAA